MPPPNTPNGARSPNQPGNYVVVDPPPRQMYHDTTLNNTQQMLSLNFEPDAYDDDDDDDDEDDVEPLWVHGALSGHDEEPGYRDPYLDSDYESDSTPGVIPQDHLVSGQVSANVPDHGPKQADAEESTVIWQDLEYVGEVDDNLQCGICKTPFYRPVTTRSCGHTFCSSCLGSYLWDTMNRTQSREAPCPMCRTQLSLPYRRAAKSLAEHVSDPCNRLVDNLLDKLDVKCPNNAQLCGWTGPRSTADKHVRDRCAYTLVPCAMQDCTRRIIRGAGTRARSSCLHYEAQCNACDQLIDMSQEYEHLNTVCPMYKAPCEACGKTVARGQLDLHREACWNETAPCAFTDAGCRVVDSRGQIKDHEQSCIYGVVKGLEERVTLKVIAAEEMQRENRKIKRELQETREQLESLQHKQESWSHFTAPQMLEAFRGLDNRVNDLTQEMGIQNRRQSKFLVGEITRLKQELIDVQSQVGVLGMHLRWMGDRTRQKQNILSGLAGSSRSGPDFASASNDGESRPIATELRPRAASNEPRPSL